MMDDALVKKLDAAKEEICSKFPNMKRAKAAFPAIRRNFSDKEIARIKERYEEITAPSEIDADHDEETPPRSFAFEYYFLKNLLDIYPQ